MATCVVDVAETTEPLCGNCGGRVVGKANSCDVLCEGCMLDSCVNATKALCMLTESKNPFEVVLQIMRQPCTRLNGEEHHFLVGAALLAAYKNCGGAVDLVDGLAVIIQRGRKVPYGVCTTWGTCGAGLSSADYISVISKAANLCLNDERGLAAVMASRSLGLITSQKGPRCCKRDSFVAILEAADITAKIFGVQMELPERLECDFHKINCECVHNDCRFFPLNLQG